jgi:hypothetical protein
METSENLLWKGLLPTYAPGTHSRGMCPHRGVVNALLRGDKPTVQVLTVDVVIAELCHQRGIKTMEEMRQLYKPNDLLPTATDSQEGVRKSTQQKPDSKHSITLKNVMGLLPTPTLRDDRAGCNQKTLYKEVTNTLSSQAVSHVNPSHRLEKGREQTITATSGRRCLELYEISNRHGSSLKTCVDYLLSSKEWYSSKCALTWKEKVTKSNRLLFQLSPSTHRTEEIGCGLLPTAATGDVEGGCQSNRVEMTNNRFILRKKNKPEMTYGAKLSDAVGAIDRMLPTPKVGAIDDTNERSLKKGNLCAVVHHGSKTGLKLQPNFVEWMMGFPQNWTDLNYPNQDTELNDSRHLETRSFPKSLSKLCMQSNKQKPTNKEGNMSMETELARIADALERIEKKMFAPVVTEETKAEPKRKSTKAVKETVAPAPEPQDDGWFEEPKAEQPAVEEVQITVDDLLKYCNGKLALLKTAEERKAKVQQIIAYFTKAFGVNNVKSVPTNKTNEAKQAFDKIMGA